MKKLTRSRNDRCFKGVCGGLAECYGIDPAIVRILWVLFTLCGGFPGMLAYMACWLIIPLEE